MAASSGRAPKQWSLTRSETVTSFEAWKNNLTYTLSLDPSFSPFIEATWEKKAKSNPYRGFKDDSADADKKHAVLPYKKITLWN
ncbi:hypothetical protein HOLleu_42388 [Holothuria leucospilota]|uniref:Uncharacterized protein n=1 Tax=Holothuria leucospilota TaxID=206669 RepID=A0A9Q1BA62_HOLLE|nr:hypothetical protein HOLleu_42388 [Holothuria leucospilota]